MPILIAACSILTITALARLVGRYTEVKVCPICAGTAVTWLAILVLMRGGIVPPERWGLVAGILMGGSVVGIAYAAERHLADGHSPLFWKALFVPTGFVIVWAIVTGSRGLFLASTAILGVELWYFMVSPPHRRHRSQKVEQLEREMKECC
jgi:hypothetical protein